MKGRKIMGVQKSMYFRILIEKLINELDKDIQMIEEGYNNWASEINRGKSIILDDALEQLITMRNDMLDEVQMFHGAFDDEELNNTNMKIKKYFKNEIRIMTEVENIKYMERQYKLVRDSDIFKEYRYIKSDEYELVEKS